MTVLRLTIRYLPVSEKAIYRLREWRRRTAVQCFQGRRRMDSLPRVWEAFSQMAEVQENSGVVDALANFEPERKSLLPPPLRLTPRPPTTSSPPDRDSPSPTVFVSLRYVQRSRVTSTQVSLHEYRKNLSSPHTDPESKPTTVERTLRRKPKALDLHKLHTGPTSPSPPPTSSPSSSTVSLRSDSPSQRSLVPVTDFGGGGGDQAVVSSPVSPQPTTTAATDAESGLDLPQEVEYPVSSEQVDTRPCQQRKLVSKHFPFVVEQLPPPNSLPLPC